MKKTLSLPKAPIGMINRHKKTNPAEMNKILNQHFNAFKQAAAQGDYVKAYQHVKKAVSLVPGHPGALSDLAYTELRLRRYDDAYQHYMQAIKVSGSNVNTNLYDGLTEVCHHLNKKEEKIKFGRLAISTKKELTKNEPTLNIPTHKPVPFSPNPQENIIVFSLFGANPRYCETSILNTKLAQEIYPEWTCRFYVDESVPELVKQRLLANGAQVVHVSPTQKQLSGLFWRFLVMDDPVVKRFLVRDADSIVSYREKAAVDAWLKSDQWFHLMRDSYSHTELILAGMWGGCTGIFHNIEAHIRDYVATGRYPDNRVIDQHYLRYCIWPTLKQSVLVHDSQQFDENNADFPVYESASMQNDQDNFHVGMDNGSPVVTTAVNHPTAEKVYWILFDENHDEVCRYDAIVSKNRNIEVNLPHAFAKKIQLQQWKLQVYPYEN
ncbi:tetratricopeptide repeat protein [Acinetobacter baumannii]|uniref:tetratricopeptide repeat protein n=1 Tax=Acinetobacter TaxID=469 RepID=UPI000A35139F|nr:MULTISPECIES: tetratricopeptide repeat protein [Acinetobacter]MBD0493782.1 tetratricopeptide repeat protein [Acinetobacter baumannii]MDA3432529.1 tetratricopeptide repeat protein [Acinetobacter baumannii]MDA3549909.1 tetratricopeptide repeat protein [Acinetobacter sp. AOR11_HL]MDA4918726.1 tetratricopeptide repeat protein [Acinetobacter baumannii]MDO7232207.1 tetratricopeptide repeat protein [Acinetobacter baumannii]